ncbi:hypothetical protein VHN57_17375 [Sphingobium sp. WW5]|jgi:hypothetical protein|uniref:hypothetical protein n=1 Tax=Sphingobium TaxID=165695 RepID=UPI0035C6A298
MLLTDKWIGSSPIELVWRPNLANYTICPSLLEKWLQPSKSQSHCNPAPLPIAPGKHSNIVVAPGREKQA